MTKQNCFGHQNGFEHFTIDDSELEQEYDLGFKFRDDDPIEWKIHPMTGVKVWPEPKLVLYISAVAFSFPEERITIKYALTRSRFREGIAPSVSDYKYLRGEANKRLQGDVNITRKRLPGEVSSDFIML